MCFVLSSVTNRISIDKMILYSETKIDHIIFSFSDSMTARHQHILSFTDLIYIFKFHYFSKKNIWFETKPVKRGEFVFCTVTLSLISNLNREMSKKFPDFRRMLIKYILFSPTLFSNDLYY